jgi:hypothetical protein
MIAAAALTDLQQQTMWTLHRCGPADAQQVTAALIDSGAMGDTAGAAGRTLRRLTHLERLGAAHRVNADDAERFALTAHGISLL